MKVTKKILSLVLCIAMLLTSVSVGFTTNAAMNAGSITRLAQALKSNTVKNLTYDISNQGNVKDGNGKSSVTNTTTITLATYAQYKEMLDILSLIDGAIESTNEYIKFYNYSDSDNGDVRNCSNVKLVKQEILNSLINSDEISSDEISYYKIDKLFDNIFSMVNVNKYHDSNECYSTKKKDDLKERVHDYTIIKTNDYQGYLATLDSRAQIDKPVQLGAKLSLTMCRQNYVTGNISTTNHYHYAFNGETEAVKEFTFTGVNINDSVKITVDAYASYIDSVVAKNYTFKDMLDMVNNGTMSGANGFETEFNNKLNSIKSYINNDNAFNKLYKDKLEAIDQIQRDINSAKNYNVCQAIADEYNSYAVAHPNYGVYNYGAYDYDRMVSDYNDFIEIYYKLLAGGDKLVTYLSNENIIDINYYNNFTDNIVAYDLEKTASDANALYNDYKDIYQDLINEEQEAIYSILIGYVNAIESYSDQVQATFFPEGHGYLTELGRSIKCKINKNVVFFTENTKETLASDPTNKVIDACKAVDGNKEGLNDFYNEIKNATNEARANELLGETIAASSVLKDDIYQLLADRFTNQVNAARQIYTDLNEPEIVNAKTAAKLGAVFADLEDDGNVIYNFLQDESKLGLVSSETIDKYNYLYNKVLGKYKEYLRTFGISTYEQTAFDKNGVYAVRKPYESDLVKTENYTVTKDNLNGITESIDKFLNSESFKSLIDGKGIDEIILGLIERIYTDDVVNLVLQYVYPLVATELLKTWDTLPSAIKITVENVIGSLDIDVNAGIDILPIEDATEVLGLYIFPRTLARHISQKDFPDVVDKLSKVKTTPSSDNDPWQSKLLYGEDGKLNLKWGVKDRETFIKAIQAALSGIEPLLMTLLSNHKFEAVGNIGSGSGTAKALGINIKLSVDPLTINLSAEGNEGYNNTIVPILEALGLKALNGNNFRTISELFDKGVLDPVIELITRFANAPIDTLLSVLPNLVYGLSSNMIQALLKMLKTDIGYVASADYDAGIKKDHLDNVMSSGDEPISINIGEMLDIESLLGLRLSNINALIKKIGLDIPEIDVGAIATCGKLVASNSTMRSDWIYAHSYLFDANGNELPVTDSKINSVVNAKKAYTIEADKADLVYYVLSYFADLLKDRDSMENIISFVSGFIVSQNEYKDENGILNEKEYDAAVAQKNESIMSLVDEIYTFVDFENKDDVIAAVVEFFNPVDNYPSVEPKWADSSFTYTAGGKTTVPYLEYSNDWTHKKSNEVLDNIDELLKDVLKATDSKEENINEVVKAAIASIFKNETITNFAKALMKLGYTVNNKNIITIIKNELGIDLRTWAATFNDMLPEFAEECAAEVEERGEDLPDFTDVPTLNNVYYENEVWTVNGNEFTDGDELVFIDLITTFIKPFAKFASVLVAGENISIFNDAVELKGYDNYACSVGLLFEALGINQVDYKGDVKNYGPDVALGNVVKSLISWIDDILEGNTIKKIVTVLPKLVYFIESNGISAVLYNLFMPIAAILDNIRPLFDLNIDAIISSALSDLLECVSNGMNSEDGIKVVISKEKLLAVLAGDEVENKYNVSIDDICLEEALKLVDGILSTSFATSKLVTYGINGLCAGKTAVNNSVTGKSYTSSVDAADTLTILITALIESLQDKCVLEDGVVSTNGDVVCSLIQKLLPEDSALNVDEIYGIVLDLIKGFNITYTDPNWAYMYSGENALEQLIKNGLPSRTGDNSIIFTKYTNNWNDATATFLNNNLKSIISDIVKAAEGNDTSIGIMLDAAITDGLYKDAILCDLLEAVIKLIADFDYAIINTAGALLDINFDSWIDICEIERDESGKAVNVTCIKDWGIDSKATNEEKKETFVSAFTTTLSPLNRVLEWLFFGVDYQFLNASDKSDIITLSGSQGYDFGIVPILEAIGYKDVKPSSYYLENGTYNVSKALGDVLTAVCDTLTAMCGDDTLGVMLEMLPNVVYFINAGGLSSSIINIIEPINIMLEKLEPIINRVSIDEAIGFPLTNFTFDTIFDLIADEVGLHFRESSKSFVRDFYMGKIESFKSVNGKTAYRMTYTEAEGRREMISILLSLALENIKYDQNEEILSEWFGEDIYKSIINVLNITKAKEMQEFSWYNTEYADTDKTFSGLETSGKYTVAYDNYWTRDKAMYMAENLPDFVDFVIKLLDVNIGGKKIENVNSLIDAAINDNLCTQENADQFILLLRDITSKLTQLEPYGEYIGQILKTSLGFDITAWDNMTVNVIKGDMNSFANAFAQIVAPAAPLFKVMLCGESINFFVDTDGNDLVKIPGSEGYAYGIIPLLEALGCDNILTPTEFKAVIDKDEKAAVRAVIDPIINKIKYIVNDPVDNLLDMLPALIYFINSNGIDTCVKNIVNAIDNLLAALEPVVGETDICKLAGLDLSTYDFEWIVNLVIKTLEEKTGYDLSAVDMDAIAELTVGKVISYKSKNGEKYYTMKYASDLDKGDMVTILLRMMLEFITVKDNLNNIENLLSGYITDKTTYKAVCLLLESFARTAAGDKNKTKSMYIVYYIFQAINEEIVEKGKTDISSNDLWKMVIKVLNNSSNSIIKDFSSGILDRLKDFFGMIFDFGGKDPDTNCSCGCHKKGISHFFWMILNFFRKLFRINKYRSCECGKTHW